MSLKRVLTALVGIPVLVVIVHQGVAAVSLLLVIVCTLAILEFFNMLDAHFYKYQKNPGLVFNILLLAAFYFQSQTGIHFPVFVITVSLMVFLLGAVLTGELTEMFVYVSTTMLGVLYIGGLAGYIILLRGLHSSGESLVYLLLITTWFSDSFAYWVGTGFGKHKLAKDISPNKSWEGAAAGLAAAVIAAMLWREVSCAGIFGALNLSLEVLRPVQCAFIGLLLGVSGQLGDLAESLFKRNAGVKDSGEILPGHGGILDRCDGLIFSAPVLYYYIKFIGLS